METETDDLHFERDGDSLHGTVIRPSRGQDYPAVVIVPAIHGVNPYILGVAERFSERGYVSLVFDLYSRGDGPPQLGSREQILAAVAALPDDRVAADVAAAGRAALTMDGVSAVGVMGFCIGGLYAYLASCRDDCFEAAVNFYGMIRYDELTSHRPVSPIDFADELNAPMLCHYGEQDPWCPPDDVSEFDARLAASDKSYELYRYAGAGHAFHEHHRAVAYRPAAASAAWSRSMDYFDYYLKGIHS